MLRKQKPICSKDHCGGVEPSVLRDTKEPSSWGACRSNERRSRIPHTFTGFLERNCHTDIRTSGSTTFSRERNYGSWEEGSQSSVYQNLRGPPTHAFCLVDESLEPAPRAFTEWQLVDIPTVRRVHAEASGTMNLADRSVGEV